MDWAGDTVGGGRGRLGCWLAHIYCASSPPSAVSTKKGYNSGERFIPRTYLQLGIAKFGILRPDAFRVNETGDLHDERRIRKRRPLTVGADADG